MCLQKVKKFQIKRDYGWKVFHKFQGKLYPTYFSNFDGKSFPVSEWFKDEKEGNCTNYPKGFHIFVTKQGARWWGMLEFNCEIKKVHFRHVVATGTQSLKNFHVIVAKEIFIDA